MKHIIHQIGQDFINNITKKALSEKIYNLDSLAGELEDDCKATAARIMEGIVANLNRQIREDKETRKELNVIKLR